MHLVLAPRRRLAAAYGPAAPAALAALDAALEARAATVATRAYDPESGLADLGVAPAALEPAALVGQLRAIAEALARRGTLVSSLWLIGGPDLIPFGTLPNPVPDRDGPLLTDAVYGMADAADPLPRWPVGRTPDGQPRQPGLLADLLTRVAAAHRRGPRQQGPPVALSAARWRAVAAEVAPDLEWWLAPPARSGALDRGALAAARLICCNLHGVRHSPRWYGQGPGDAELVPALGPADLQGLELDGPVVVSQACFGARLAPVGESPSLAPALLAAGAAAVIAAHGLAYGAIDPPPGESDLLVRQLLRELARPGARIGPAFLEAHLATLRELVGAGQLDATEIKTLSSFVLYGDPALPWMA